MLLFVDYVDAIVLSVVCYVYLLLSVKVTFDAVYCEVLSNESLGIESVSIVDSLR